MLDPFRRNQVALALMLGHGCSALGGKALKNRGQWSAPVMLP